MIRFEAVPTRGLALALVIGAAGGWLFAEIRMPLAWMMGAMCLTTVAALAGAPLAMPPALRSLMIAVVGTMLGSAFTPNEYSKYSWLLPGLAVAVARLTRASPSAPLAYAPSQPVAVLRSGAD